MSLRNYSNLASNTTTTANVPSSSTGASTVIAVADQTGWPAAPFTAALERGKPTEEIVLVTAVSGLNLTCTRGQDGTTAGAHVAPVSFEHVTAKIDYAEANAHVNTTTDAHADGSGLTHISLLRQPTGSAMTLASTNHPFQIGADADHNLRADQFGYIQSAAAGAAQPLYLNPFGGGVWVNSTAGQDEIKGAARQMAIARAEIWADFSGTITLDTSYYLNWTGRLMYMHYGGGSGWINTNGFLAMTPPAATTTVTMHNDSGLYGNQTATAAGVPIPPWCGLFYANDLGTDATVSNDANWHLVNFGAANFEIPSNWIKVAQRHNDDNMVKLVGGVRLGPGSTFLGTNTNQDYIAPTMANSWVNYGSGYNTIGYALDANGYVHMRGLVKNGTFSGTVPVFTLPAGYRPAARCLFASYSNTVLGRVDVLANGQVMLAAGDNGYFSFENVIFKAVA